MRVLTALLTIGAALCVSVRAPAQPPGYEVRTYKDDDLTPFDPVARTPTSENTLKEPWVCPYCGYSTGGTWDTSGAGGAPWDTDGDGIPDEAEGDCPDPWGVHGTVTAPLVPAGAAERFMSFGWIGSTLNFLRGIPFKPGEVDPAAGSGGPTNALSRVRAAFAFDPGNTGSTGFAAGTTQVRFLLIPPGVARPTARYRSLRWAPGTSANPPVVINATGEWGTALTPGNLRIGVHPWRAVDRDIYHVRVRRPNPGNDLDIQVWSETNGLEFNSVNPPNPVPADAAQNLLCASGAVRISFAADTFQWWDDLDGADVDPPQWWAFDFVICNNSRIMPTAGDDGTAPWQPDWVTNPTTPLLTDPLPPAPDPSPANYFTAASVGGRGVVNDTDLFGSRAAPMGDTEAIEFRLRPGETGTGMVAVLWRNDPGAVWSYDEDETPPGPGDPEPAHANGIQPVAARFFCSRVDTANPVLDIPAGAPGGATDVGVTGTGDLQVTNRQIGEVVRCPVHVPYADAAAMQAARGLVGPDFYIDPWWVGGTVAANGDVVGRAPGGDTPFVGGTPLVQGGVLTSPPRAIGCGAIHTIGTATACWCGRTHDPTIPNTMYCNYCGTRLLASGTAMEDAERAAARIDVDAPQAVASHPVAPDVRHTDGVYSLPSDAVRSTKDGVVAPGATFGAAASTQRTVTNPLFASLPAFALPSFEPGAGGIFENGIARPYQGAYVAYRVADEDHVWYEDLLTGSHARYPAMTSALSRRAVCDGDGRWDTFYRCPDCGNKHPALALAPGTGAAPYTYTDRWTSAAWPTELECSYGRTVGAAAPNTDSEECPGHQICPACGVAWEVQGEGQTSAELETMALTVCPFDGTPLVNADTLQTRLIPDDLTAEEFDPLIVQASITRQTRLAASRPTADLGRVQRDWNSGVGPAEMTPIAEVGTHSDSNYTVSGAALLTQGLTCANMAGAGARSVTTSALETPALVRMDADPNAEGSSAQRAARALPITRERLFAGLPWSYPAAGDWGSMFASGLMGGAGGHAADALMRGGTALALPLPIGEGSGNYNGAALAFVDTDANGALNFLDRSAGLAATDSLATPFDATEDYPLEPVVPLTLRLRVAESRLPHNSPYASDATPAPLFADTDDDGLHDRLDVVWESNRPGAAVDAPVNLFEATTTGAQMLTSAGGPLAPGIARDYSWIDDGSGNPRIDPITAEATAGAANGSPEVYIDRANGRRWLVWHRVAPTEVGVASTLWSASAAGNMSDTFGSAGTANFIFDSGLDKSWIRGFINANAAGPANHWSFWNSGKRGKEEVHYCYGVLGAGQTPDTAGYNPQDPNTVADNILPVSNGVPASAKRDWVDYGGTAIRKPPKSPFVYAKDPAPIMDADPLTGEWMLRVFFTGFVPQENNSDICYTRFRMSDLANPDANYGKVVPWVVYGPTGGEELRADGPRQTFGSRHLDWVTTRRRPNETADADFMRAVSPALDPQIFIHLVVATPTGRVHEAYQVTWAQEAAPGDRLPHRYDRAEGVYRLSGLTFTRLTGSAFAASYNPVEPRTGRDLELMVDPAAGLVRFSAPLFNPTDVDDPATYFNSTAFPGLDDVQVWANYRPFVFRLCRSDANDDSPSAFFDYGGPGLTSPVAAAAARVSLGRTVVFWRRSHGASEPPHFGRTSFMYKTYTSAIEVAQPPIGSLTDVTDVTLATSLTPVGQDPAAGIIGLPWDVVNPGDRIRVEYDSVPAGAGRVEYHIAPGWGEEQRVNVDTVYSEGPLLAKREWYAVPVTDVGGTTANQYLARYWLFWTSPRQRYTYDSTAGTSELTQSRDVYYATVVPEYGTSVTEVERPSR